MAAPCHIDHIATGLQLRQVGAVQNVFGLGGERQQIHQHLGGRQKFAPLGVATEAAHTGQVFGAAAPAIDRKLERLQRQRHPLAQHAQAHHTDRKVAALARFAKRPTGFGLGFVIGVEFAKVAHQGMQHVFGHLHRHARVFQPHQHRLRRPAQGQQGVHPGTGVEDHLQARLRIQKIL